MTTGTVKFFNTQKGFGFITPEGGASDVFVHISAVEQAGMTTLHEGQRLSFDVVTDQKRGTYMCSHRFLIDVHVALSCERPRAAGDVRSLRPRSGALGY